MNGYDIYRVRVSKYQTNCYILKSRTSNGCVIVDPGGDYTVIKNALDKINGSCRLILLTHGHFDHIFGVDDVRNTATKVCIHKDDEHYLYETDIFTSMVDYDPRPLYKADVVFESEGRYNVDGFIFSVIHTPGHTKGSVCYVFEDCMFTGDTIFNNCIGTTLFGGDDEMLNDSLRRLYNYPGDYILYPGHNDTTTLSDERLYNPYMKKFKRNQR